MKWIFWLGMFPLLNAQTRLDQATDFPVRPGTPWLMQKNAANVEKTLAHVSVNNQWKSSLLIRSDAKFDQSFSLFFYAPNGAPLSVSFTDTDGAQYSGEGFNFSLTGYEIYGLNFTAAGSWPSIQVIAVTSVEHRYYSIENTYSRYDGSTKLASVGTLATEAYTQFIMDMDERIDAVSAQQKFRGLAITNTGSANCNCTVYLYDEGANGANTQGAVEKYDMPAIPVNGKWLGYAIDLFPQIDARLGKGFGYLYGVCDQPVAVIGLSFEENSPSTGSVPVESVE